MRNFLHHHLLKLILVPLFILFVSASYVRFVFSHDYLVSYEVDCDPSEESCFIGCEDVECNEEYYYYLVEKDEKSLQRSCGIDITGCAESTMCLSTDKHCSVGFCEPGSDMACKVPADYLEANDSDI